MTSGLAQVSNSRLIGSSLCISHLAGNQAVAANIAIRPYRSNDHAEVVALLKAGADGKVKDSEGKTAFDHAQNNAKLRRPIQT